MCPIIKPFDMIFTNFTDKGDISTNFDTCLRTISKNNLRKESWDSRIQETWPEFIMWIVRLTKDFMYVFLIKTSRMLA